MVTSSGSPARTDATTEYHFFTGSVELMSPEESYISATAVTGKRAN